MCKHESIDVGLNTADRRNLLDFRPIVVSPSPTALNPWDAFCRGFIEPDVLRFQEIFDETRLQVWNQQPAEFFEEAFLDADGTLGPISDFLKQGVEIALTASGNAGDSPTLGR